MTNEKNELWAGCFCWDTKKIPNIRLLIWLGFVCEWFCEYRVVLTLTINPTIFFLGKLYASLGVIINSYCGGLYFLVTYGSYLANLALGYLRK